MSPWIGNPSELVPRMDEHPLRIVLARCEQAAEAGRAALVVFDLDSTLFSTAGRNLRILREFAARHSRRWPEAARIAGALQPEDMGWSVVDDARAAGLVDEDALGALFAFWRPRFFDGSYTRYDRPTPGAPAYVRRVHATGALVYYLTGRTVQQMGAGTVQGLELAGFPLWRGRTVLHLKPRTAMGDLVFKEDAVQDIRSHGAEVIATFENEPSNANLFVRAFPNALSFLISTVHSPRPVQPRPELIRFGVFRPGLPATAG